MGTVTVLDDEMLLVLIMDIRESFGKWRISEVENAFSLGLKGRLEIDLNLYNKPLNLVFLSNLMKAYREFIRPALNREAQGQLTTKSEPTDVEKKEMSLKALKTSFEHFKKTGEILNYGNSIYNLVKDKINYPNSEFEKEATLIYTVRFKEVREKELHKISFLDFVKALDNNKVVQKDIEKIICDLKLKKYFTKIKKS